MAINVLKLYFFQIKFFFCFPVCSSPSGLTQSSLSSAWMMSWVSACYLGTLLKWLNIGNIFLMSPWFWFLLTVSFENRIIAQSERQETQIESWYGFLQRGKRYVNDWIKYQARIELATTVLNTYGIFLPASRAFWWTSFLHEVSCKHCGFSDVVFTCCRKLRIWLEE